ncbi:superantigen-like protein SSL4 [Aromatoleum toluclasticum]|uniref:hypothetical protein n=1 Tax=Aromatoleum toluclasticum TaxID=92003 RepID=UPI0012FBE588|nr:hypothetical protein [Aromatoleum toluclasticum]
MTFKTLLFSSLLAATATMAIGAEHSVDPQPNVAAEQTKSESVENQAPQPKTRHDHAAERLGVTANTPADPVSDKSTTPRSQQTKQHDHMRDMK